MNKENKDIINKFLLVGDKFMPGMHLWVHSLKINKELKVLCKMVVTLSDI